MVAYLIKFGIFFQALQHLVGMPAQAEQGKSSPFQVFAFVFTSFAAASNGASSSSSFVFFLWEEEEEEEKKRNKLSSFFWRKEQIDRRHACGEEENGRNSPNIVLHN